MTASPKIPFQWERLTDEGKVAYIDSAKVAIEKARASGSREGDPQIMMRPGMEGSGARREGAATAPAPNAQRVRTITGRKHDCHNGRSRRGRPGGPLPPLTMVSPSELPDYKPAFAPGSTRADADGNLWIRTSQNVNALPVYNVVNRKGELIDRVQLPQNRVLVGFGPGGSFTWRFATGRLPVWKKRAPGKDVERTIRVSASETSRSQRAARVP